MEQRTTELNIRQQMMTTATNNTIEVLTNHRVYRDFDHTAVLPKIQLDAIIAAAQQAPSWMNGQHYSIINISDSVLRQKIAALQPKNPQIASCSVFLVIIADAYKTKLASDAYNGSFAYITDPDNLITLVTDAAMAAQNATIAAESFGLGTCPIGGIRSVSQQIIELLELPKYTLPLFGLCIGTPTVSMPLKPRLPKASILFENTYKTTHLAEQLATYEQTMLEFGEARELLPYRQKLANFYSNRFVANQTAIFQQQGFMLSV